MPSKPPPLPPSHPRVWGRSHRFWRRVNRFWGRRHQPVTRREERLVQYLLRCPDFTGRFMVNHSMRLVRFSPSVPSPLSGVTTETSLDVLLLAAREGGHDAARRLCWRLLEAVAEPPAGR